MSTSQIDPMVGRLVDGRYQVRARIARGGMATVYLATDLRLERRVAIKIMHGHLADDAAFRDRFIQEARSAARLSHPNVVNVFDQGQDSDMAYLVMEYLQGITLRDLLKEYGKLTAEQTMDIMESVLAGLAAAHKAGIVHRDLKPENVLLADDGRIKIGDFGLARAATANTASGQALLGTIAYLSPELVTRGIADTRSDIYAVGIMMFEMLVGDQPFKGDQPVQIAYQHANDSVPMPSTKNPAVPVALDELVLWATARDPEHRPRDARAMLDQLFETQNVIRDGRGTGPVPGQRTAVMPSLTGPVPLQSAAETNALARARRTGPIALETATRLAVDTQKRKRRGYWLFAFVIVLTGLAVGTGWYFGSGPGAQITVPTVAGKSIQEATDALTEAGFAVGTETRQVWDYQVAVGSVSSTDPPAGSSASHDSDVVLLVSQGPEPLPVPAVVGGSEEEANTALGKDFTVGEPVRLFDGAAAGTVLRILSADGSTEVASGSNYSDHGTLRLVVSLGPIPDVVGKPVDQAIQELRDKGITATVRTEEFDNSGTVPAGSILALDDPVDASGNPRALGENDAVTLVVSKGQDLVVIPAVVGTDWPTAKQALLDADLVPNYKAAADSLTNVKVASIDPSEGDSVLRGSTVTVTLTATL